MHQTTRATTPSWLRTTGVVVIATLALSALSVAAGASSHRKQPESAAPKPTIVLVHGAFADASSWSSVTGRLQHDGFTVVAPAIPMRGLESDSAYLRSVLASIPGPVVLAAHSYGGAVATDAASDAPNVKALVYIAAFVPDVGESLMDLSGKFAGSKLATAIVTTPYSAADLGQGVDVTIKADQFRDVFTSNEVSAASAQVLAASQRPLSLASLNEKATEAAWTTIPSWALVATRDHAIAPDLERFEARRAKSHTVEVTSSHDAMATHPDAVTALILKATATTR